MKGLLLFFLVLLHAAPSWCDALIDDLFDRTRIHDVRISMAASDWAALRANYQANTSYDATVTIDGQTVSDSSIRSRGSGTRNGIKPGLRVDFDRRIRTQRFRGFKSLVIDNMYNDPSLLREQLAFSLFEEMGIRVPREAFATLTVNGQYWGLYAIVEPIDQIFVSAHVDGGGGNLFEYNAPAAATPEQLLAWDFSLSRGTTVDSYVPSPFEPKTNEDDLDASALLDFIRTVSEAPDTTFVDQVSAFIDPREILTYYAVEVATAEVDGLTSFFGVNNFYLYQRQGSRRFVFIPWDHDFNFASAGHPIYFGADRNRLIQRLLNDPAMRLFYRDTLLSITARFMNAGWMGPRIDSLSQMIRQPVQQDTKRRSGDDPIAGMRAFDDAVAHIRSVVAGRHQSVAGQLSTARRRSVAP